MKNGWISGYKCRKHYKNDVLHRDGEPAIERDDGTVEYWEDGVCHRLNDPAVIWEDGSYAYYHHGRLHRLDGPAVRRGNGRCEYWIRGVKFTKEQFDIVLNSLA